eukprot:comp5849_c0_seq1/m.1714 comp5849_c0_seq1/g.1714  ORF comp5849_c0_seq1/g.1714 comp5849_c0_seq1/m.1714 type:complete len:320 (-) comp5849_c0_seq1:33-992(-)
MIPTIISRSCKRSASFAPALSKAVSIWSNRTYMTLPSLNSEFELAGACTAVNGRPYNEDRHSIVHFSPDLAFFGVFDGHGGSEAAEFAKNNLPRFISEELENGAGLQTALLKAFRKTDEAFHLGPSGTTATCALLNGHKLLVAGVGDSRAVILHKDSAKDLSVEHKPEMEAEMRRIKAAGGTVTLDPMYGTYRVCGRLAMSRSIGDRELKPFGVIAEPSIYDVQLSRKDSLLILGTDGLFNVISKQLACAVANSCRNPEEAAQELVSLAIQLGSTDNVTALVVRLSGWGKYPNRNELSRLRASALTVHRNGRLRPTMAI